MIPKLIIDNRGWPEERCTEYIEMVKPYLSKLVKQIHIANNIIIRLERFNPKDEMGRACFDKGTIAIYFPSKDWVGDTLHEVGHMIARWDKMSYKTRSVITSLMYKLQENDGDGRVFVSKHDMKNEKEVLATLLKWYFLSIISHPGYGEVLENFVPGSTEICRKIIYGGEKLTKSEEPKKKLVFKLPPKKDFEIKEPDLKNGVTTFSGYKIKKRINFHGLQIAIENPAGTTRSGIDAQGNRWKTTMRDHYGYINGTHSNEPRDHLDCFVSAIDPSSDTVFVIKQCDPESKMFDEDKVILGTKTEKEAIKVYQRNFDSRWKERILEVKKMTVKELHAAAVENKRINL